MNCVKKTWNHVSNLYRDINPATLSGAIDVIVVRGADGRLEATPFHVRFGKFKLLRPNENCVRLACLTRTWVRTHASAQGRACSRAHRGRTSAGRAATAHRR